MFCIAAFIILAILSIFSARYRLLALNAWKCTSRKVTFRACDTSFKEDLKSQLLAKHALKRPRLTRFLDKWLDVLALIFVVLTIWSLFVVIKSGINLFVYDTCNPNNSESCSLGAEACSVTTGSLGFWNSIKQGKIVQWTADEVSQFGETIMRIPDRLKDWDTEKYRAPIPTYYSAYSTEKPTIVEVIDPSCQYCAKLFRNMKNAAAEQRYNITYLAYPIPDETTDSGYKFRHSPLLVRYLEATKLLPLREGTPADWQILERLFTWNEPSGITYQLAINSLYDESRVVELLHEWLSDMGYSEEDIEKIDTYAASETVIKNIQTQKSIIESELHVIKIPTVLLDGRRYDGVVNEEKFK